MAIDGMIPIQSLVGLSATFGDLPEKVLPSSTFIDSQLCLKYLQSYVNKGVRMYMAWIVRKVSPERTYN